MCGAPPGCRKPMSYPRRSVAFTSSRFFVWPRVFGGKYMEKFLEIVNLVNGKINGVVWGPVMLVLLLAQALGLLV